MRANSVPIWGKNELLSRGRAGSGLVPGGHVSLVYSGFTPESYNSFPQFGPGYREVVFSVDSSVQDCGKGEFYAPKTKIGSIKGIFRELPDGIREDVFSKYREMVKEIKSVGPESQDIKMELRGNLEQLKKNINRYAEFRDLENRLEEKKIEVVESFGRSMPLDSDIREEAQRRYQETDGFWKDYRLAVKADSNFYSRLKKANAELGMVASDLPSAMLVLEEDFISFGDSELKRDDYDKIRGTDYECLDKEALIKGVYKAAGTRFPGHAARKFLKTAMVLQSGEFPTIDKYKRRGEIISKEVKKDHTLRNKIFAVGATALFAGVVVTGIHGQMTQNDAGYHFKKAAQDIGNYFSGGSSGGSAGGQNTTEPVQAPVLTPWQNWTLEYFGSVDHPKSAPNMDPDHDYVDNLFEYENGTNPKTPYTFDNLDDFNLLYAYPHYITDLSNRTQTQKEINQLLERIPDVEPRHWTNTEGSARNNYKNGKYTNVSLRDPLVQYYADKLDIKWYEQNVFGKTGVLRLDDEKLLLEDGRYDCNKTTTPPAVYLTKGRKGNCAEVAIAHMALLLSKGYECTYCSAMVPTKNGRICTPSNDSKYVSHAFLETRIDGKIYIGNANRIVPMVDKNGVSAYEIWGWKLNDRYDPNWAENENYRYQ